MERKTLLSYQFCMWRNKWKREIMSLPKACKGRIYSSLPYQLYLKIKIKQSSFWHYMTGQIMDSVFDMSFNCVGSLKAQLQWIWGNTKNKAHLRTSITPPWFLMYFQSHQQKNFKEKRRSYSQKSERTTLEKSEIFLKLSLFFYFRKSSFTF